MKRISYTSDLCLLLPLVKKGDILRIIPKENFPNAKRQFTVIGRTDDGFEFYDRETYVMPYYWIKKAAIVGVDEEYLNLEEEIFGCRK